MRTVVYVNYDTKVGIDMSEGYLFFNIDDNLVKIPERMAPQTMPLYLKKFVEEVNLDLEQNLPVSMHYFRSGGAIAKFLEGQPLEKIMHDAAWKNPQTM